MQARVRAGKAAWSPAGLAFAAWSWADCSPGCTVGTTLSRLVRAGTTEERGRHSAVTEKGSLCSGEAWACVWQLGTLLRLQGQGGSEELGVTSAGTRLCRKSPEPDRPVGDLVWPVITSLSIPECWSDRTKGVWVMSLACLWEGGDPEGHGRGWGSVL